ncbi:MAG: hypothetical protein PHF86_06215 [Candidatus Nanoarchaeia archaeon]|jgi:hypothetical protein|nr:hypothetical protein [Candidatus Nanoarchaeia archaeon]
MVETNYNTFPVCWRHIAKRIITREGPIYYVGGSLCIDNIDKSGGVALNLNGKGFVYSSHAHMKNSTFFAPKSILELVKECYLSVKGNTNHYKEIVQGALNAN